MKIGKAIKELRLKKALNQKNYSSRIGITQSYLSQIETGVKKPSTELLELIANDLDIPLPIIFWFSVEENDINENKREFYKILKPSIDALISSFF